MNNLFKRFRRDIGGLIWLASAVFTGLALWSYRPTDPSLNSIGKNLIAQNYCGYFGSFLSDLLYQSLGFGAWLLVAGGLRMAIKYFTGQETKFSRLRLLLATLLVVNVASLCALYFPNKRVFNGQIQVGGEVGRLVAKGLVSVFNNVGVAIILWTMLVALVVFYTERPLAEIFHWPIREFRAWWMELAKWKKESRRVIQAKLRAISSLTGQPALAGASAASSSPSSESFTPEAKRQGLGSFFPLSKESREKKQRESEPDADERAEEAAAAEPEITVEPARRRVRMAVKVARRIENWNLPKISLLEDPPAFRGRLDEKEIKNKARLLVEKLAQFSIMGDVVGIKPGPAVTMFEFKPAADVKISRITDLADDLSLALSSESVRIIAPIPGRDVVGIETSNSQRESVYLKDIVAEEAFWNEECKLPVPLGRRADGEPRIVDLRKMPHLLVAGSTGSGKSVFVVSTLTALLFRHSPKTLRLILVDPKQVDLAAFSNVPHLIMPPIREPRRAVGALRWAIREMEKRYRSMSKFGARGIESFNEMVSGLTAEELKQHEEYNQVTDGPQKQDSYYFNPLPYICIVVEEFGDLMAVDKVNVEQAVVRLAQMARACGIHLILAMQSPRKDVVTGLIKTNIPGRISFKVSSKMDSRIILDESGAERLLARGDMLFLAPGVSKPERHHGPFLSEAEINAVVQSWREQGEPEFDPLALRAIDAGPAGEPGDIPAQDAFADEEIQDERYDEVLAYVSTVKEVSASMLQRRFRLGYPRAARMIEVFESEGVVGPANGSKPRQVLIKELK